MALVAEDLRRVLASAGNDGVLGGGSGEHWRCKGSGSAAGDRLAVHLSGDVASVTES